MPTLVARTANTNYIVLMPPGDVLKEKIFEMGMDASVLAHHCKLPVETILGILDTSLEMTQVIAEKLEHVTRIQAEFMDENGRRLSKAKKINRQSPKVFYRRRTWRCPQKILNGRRSRSLPFLLCGKS